MSEDLEKLPIAIDTNEPMKPNPPDAPLPPGKPDDEHLAALRAIREELRRLVFWVTWLVILLGLLGASYLVLRFGFPLVAERLGGPLIIVAVVAGGEVCGGPRLCVAG